VTSAKTRAGGGHSTSLARDLTELAESSQERSAPRIGIGGNYGNADIERRVSRESEIREGFRGGQRKRGGPVKFRALRRRMCRRLTRFTERASHQLGAIRPPRGDSNHCMLPEGLAPSDQLWRASEEHGRRTQDAKSARGSSERLTRGLPE